MNSTPRDSKTGLASNSFTASSKHRGGLGIDRHGPIEPFGALRNKQELIHAVTSGFGAVEDLPTHTQTEI